MLQITGTRGSGKTAALVAAFKADPDGVLVFRDQSIRRYALDKWPELKSLRTVAGCDIDFAIMGRESRLYVDEIGTVQLSRYARERVVAWCGG